MKKRFDPVIEDAHSAQFLVKVRNTQLNHAAKAHKQQSKLKFHQFHYIQTAKDLNSKRKKLEDALGTWIHSTASSEGWIKPEKEVIPLEIALKKDCEALYFQLNGVTEIAKNLINLLRTQGKNPVLSPQISSISSHLLEVKEFVNTGFEELKAQEMELEEEIRGINLDNFEEKTGFLDLPFPSIPIPG